RRGGHVVALCRPDHGRGACGVQHGFPEPAGAQARALAAEPGAGLGHGTLASIRYAMYVLNQEYAPTVGTGPQRAVRFNADNTLVIAGSVSNGGAAVLRAAEQDTERLIDG